MRKRWPDVAFVVLAAALTLAAQPHLLAAETLVSLDTATQYFPWYAFLGESLRSGHIPGWNPAVFSGTPFAADPLSGWTYFPAMLVFALLPIGPAIRLYLVLQPLLAACGAYVFSRNLRLDRTGALTAAVAYSNGGLLQVQNVRSSPFASVYACLPFALLGSELALRSDRWQTRFAGWGLAALALSQIIAVWPAQGAYYAALLVGGYIAWRALFSFPFDRGARLLLNAVPIFGLAVALDAAAILPRLEFDALSNLAGGYTAAEAVVGGLHPRDWLLLVTPSEWYVGASVLALALAAVLVQRQKLPGSVAYFGITSLLALLISGSVETPLHWLLYHLVPGFARLHPHAPERILTVAYLGPALLAGTTVTVLGRRGWSLRTLLVLVVAIDLGLGGAKARGDLLLTDATNGIDKLTPIDDLSRYFQPDAAALFLRERMAESPGRYLGYAPYVSGGGELPYTFRFYDPATAALDVNNRALPLRLQDAQGYDATHLQRYDAYVAALNGRTQNYHDAEVFRPGLSSPLLDLLNVRYVMVPPADRLDPADATALQRFNVDRPIYTDANVRILANPSAFPRAWIVHTAVRLPPDQALVAIHSGQLDAHVSATLEETPPPLSSLDSTMDRAEVVTDDAECVSVSTSSSSTGMLVLSEIDYPAWRAYVDDQPTHIYVAYGALRAVALPAGAHRVELRYESETLFVGLLISVVGILALLGCVSAPLTTRRGRSRFDERPRRPLYPT